jgi:putative ABC transport system permease protein
VSFRRRWWRLIPSPAVPEPRVAVADPAASIVDRQVLRDLLVSLPPARPTTMGGFIGRRRLRCGRGRRGRSAVFSGHAVRSSGTTWCESAQAVRNDRSGPFAIAVSIGTFDPLKLRGFTALSAVPLETYVPPQATGADDRSRQLLHGQPLQPDSNQAGYLATPPMMLTSLTALPGLIDSPAPLSAIRVRVAGVTGFDDTSRERVRNVAEAIGSATGLDVDITMGSSPAPQTVSLPAGKFGRPELG